MYRAFQVSRVFPVYTNEITVTGVASARTKGSLGKTVSQLFFSPFFDLFSVIGNETWLMKRTVGATQANWLLTARNGIDKIASAIVRLNACVSLRAKPPRVCVLARFPRADTRELRHVQVND